MNIITGDRDHLAKCLTDHQDVQAIWCHGGSATTSQYVEYASADSVKRTWVNYGFNEERDWADATQGAGEEFLYHSTEVKNVWIPMGDIFAN